MSHFPLNSYQKPLKPEKRRYLLFSLLCKNTMNQSKKRKKNQNKYVWKNISCPLNLLNKNNQRNHNKLLKFKRSAFYKVSTAAQSLQFPEFATHHTYLIFLCGIGSNCGSIRVKTQAPRFAHFGESLLFSLLPSP